jgi:hypothetical protein
MITRVVREIRRGLQLIGILNYIYYWYKQKNKSHKKRDLFKMIKYYNLTLEKGRQY